MEARFAQFSNQPDSSQTRTTSARSSAEGAHVTMNMCHWSVVGLLRQQFTHTVYVAPSAKELRLRLQRTTARPDLPSHCTKESCCLSLQGPSLRAFCVARPRKATLRTLSLIVLLTWVGFKWKWTARSSRPEDSGRKGPRASTSRLEVDQNIGLIPFTSSTATVLVLKEKIEQARSCCSSR